LVGVAERDCLLAALARLRPVRRRNRFYIIPAAYVTLHILFNHATSPMKLSAATTKVSFVFDLTPYLFKMLDMKQPLGLGLKTALLIAYMQIFRD
jgi:hypothetical protein